VSVNRSVDGIADLLDVTSLKVSVDGQDHRLTVVAIHDGVRMLRVGLSVHTDHILSKGKSLLTGSRGGRRSCGKIPASG
jgi:hypothetical protein